jgi:hypothetical protein
MIAALFVAYTRLKGALDSNLPLVYYAAIAVYTSVVDTSLSPSVVYAGFGLALLLRFEFLNATVIRLTQTLEMLVLAVITYNCFNTIYSGF